MKFDIIAHFPGKFINKQISCSHNLYPALERKKMISRCRSVEYQNHSFYFSVFFQEDVSKFKKRNKNFSLTLSCAVSLV